MDETENPAPLPPPLDQPPGGDKSIVMHETMTAIMFVALGLSALADGRPVLAKRCAELSRESVFKALEAPAHVDEVIGQLRTAVHQVMTEELRPLLERLAALEARAEKA
jgi:hypothetical protein